METIFLTIEINCIEDSLNEEMLHSWLDNLHTISNSQASVDGIITKKTTPCCLNLDECEAKLIADKQSKALKTMANDLFEFAQTIFQDK